MYRVTAKNAVRVCTVPKQTEFVLTCSENTPVSAACRTRWIPPRIKMTGIVNPKPLINLRAETLNPANTKPNKPLTKAPNKKPLKYKPKVEKKIAQEAKKPVKKEPAIREIVKKPKEKAKIPTRASNDPRYKS